MNLNELTIVNHDGPAEPLTENRRICQEVEADCYFRDLEIRVLEFIKRADFVVGCVAWLTNKKILSELANVKYGVSIVVHKEDFLRPDSRGRVSDLRKRYDSLKCRFDRYSLGNLVGSLSVAGDPSVAAVRCMGNHNSDRLPAFPRMHHKFLVACSVEVDTGLDEWQEQTIIPRRVWTGSLNLTENGTESLENAVAIKSDLIARQYYQEWEQILALSEPLDWESKWIAPEWRIGT